MINLWTWTLQVALLVAVGAAVARVLGNARARLWFWQGLMVVAVLLPVVEPWTMPLPVAVEEIPVGVTITSTGVASRAPSYWETLGWSDVLVAGAGLRFAWLAVGLWRLRRLRGKAQRIASPIATYDAQVNWYASEQITGPVTFGRTVLLPARVFDMPEGMRNSIARHELLHVERGDWWFVMAEEALRGALWFHPAIWYALSQVQLAREQVVDREVVEGTRDQAGYLEALVAVAAQKMRPGISSDIAPAPLFLKKRQLAVRVAAMLKEGPMSKAKLMARGAVAASAMFVAMVAGVWLFPLVGSAQTVADGPGITVNAGAALQHRTPVFYPSGVTATGTIVVDASVNAKGEVTDARVVSGPEDLRKAVLANVLNWHYSTQPAPPTSARVTVTFAQATQPGVATAPPPPPPPPPPPGQTKGGRGGPFAVPQPTGVIGGRGTSPQVSGVIGAIYFQSMSAELEQRASRALGLKVGDTVPPIAQMQATLKSVDEHLALNMLRLGDGQLTLIIVQAGQGAPPPPPPPPPPPNFPAGATRVSAGVANAMIVNKVAPVYPPIAKQARVQGIVTLNVLIGKDGAVKETSPVSGPAMLIEAAQHAVGQWTYKPTLLNGQPVETLTQVEINFSLVQ